MKAIFITLLALVAAPALAEFDEIANRGVQYSGSLASRATTEIQADGAQAAPDAAPAPDAQTFCRLPTSAVSGAPPGAANIDGMSINVISSLEIQLTLLYRYLYRCECLL